MNISGASTLPEVAWVVCTALDRLGVEAVLTGGSAATFYAPEAYQSRDLDFVLFSGDPGAAAEEALGALGYRREGNHYEHYDSPLILEFPPGPLAVGGEIIEHFSVLRQDDYVLRVITATDCCKDRLAAFFHWTDRGALQQALGVAGAPAEEVDFAAIERWSMREGHGDKYEEFVRAAQP